MSATPPTETGGDSASTRRADGAHEEQRDTSNVDGSTSAPAAASEANGQVEANAAATQASLQEKSAALASDLASTRHQQETTETMSGDGATRTEDGRPKVETAPKEDAALKDTGSPSSVAASSSSTPTTLPPTKKFNSLSVAKQFLQKASPTTGNAVATPLATNASLQGVGSGNSGGSIRLSTTMPASRLMAAKLSSTAKPSSPGWANVGSPSATAAGSATTTASGTDSFPGMSAASSAMNPSLSSSAGGAAASSAAKNSTSSPKLVTALARSTSPHVRTADGSKSSPGLRNAALTGAARASSPSTGPAVGAGGSRAPWASVKNDATPALPPNRRLGRPSEFPTAAEAAQAKLEAERKEKAAAAEASVRAEQSLQYLERFRGASLGPGNNWDEMDDDDLGEVVLFGDGKEYKVPTSDADTHVSTGSGSLVTKEERFRDVDHDRSWPPRVDEATRRPLTLSRPTVAKPEPPTVHGAKNVKAETVALRSGEGISLDPAPGTTDRGHSSLFGQGSRKETAPLGRRGDGPMHAQAASTRSAATNAAPPAAPPVRAWGPLAQRQASLNPDAPKGPVVSLSSPPPPTPATAVTKIVSPTSRPAAAATAPQSDPHSSDRHSVASSATSPPAVASTIAKARRPSNSTTAATAAASVQAPPMRAMLPPPDGRALPPHLAAMAGGSGGHAVQAPKRRNLFGERADWESATPRPLAESADQLSEPIQGAAGRPYGSIVVASRATEPATNAVTSEASTAPLQQRDEMLSAAERARRRRQAEEEERQKERERALAKAAAIEAKMREAEEEKERKKRAEEAKREKARQEQLEEKRKEALRQQQEVQRQQQEAANQKPAEEKKAAPSRGSRHLAYDASTQQQDAASVAPSVLSPSDEAVSWRRGPALPLDKAAPGSASKQDASAPQKVLLRRPSINEKETKNAPSPTAASNSIPTGPRAARLAAKEQPERQDGRQRTRDSTAIGGRADQHTGRLDERDRTVSRSARVEIIAPTDEGAAKHMRAQQQREREARQSRSASAGALGDGSSAPPVGVLKQPGAVAPARPKISAVREADTTRSEVPFDGPPVWNRFRISVGRSSKPTSLPSRSRQNREESRAQAIRMAKAKDETSLPPPANVLSWEPPIVNLSSRTLSRDDQFFSKKYRKGVVISNVQLPTRSMQELGEQHRRAAAERKRRLEPQSQSVPYQMSYDGAQAPSVKVPNTPLKTSATLAAPVALSTDVPEKHHMARDASQEGVAYATRPSIARASATPSPVSFTVNSEVNLRTPTASLAPGGVSRQSPSSTLPSPHNISSATWGQSSLTFSGLGASPPSKLANDDAANGSESERNRIKDVWGSLPAGAAQLPLKPTQNSLRGIVDEVPTAMSMSMHDLRSVDTAPLGGRGVNDVDVVGRNERAAATTASSPVANTSPQIGASDSVLDRQHHAMGRARSQSPSSMRHASTATVNLSPSMRLVSMGNQQQHQHQHQHSYHEQQAQTHFVQQERGGARAAFSPYAYPTSFSSSGGGGMRGGHNAVFGDSSSVYGNDGSYGFAYGDGNQQQNGTPYVSSQYRSAGGGGGRGSGMATGMRGYDSGAGGFHSFNDRNGTFATSGVGAMQNIGSNGIGVGNAFSAAGWPLDSPAIGDGGSGGGATGYIPNVASGNAYYTPMYDSTSGYTNYRQQLSDTSGAYARGGGGGQYNNHGRTPSSGYRGYNNAFGRGGMRSVSGHNETSSLPQRSMQPHGSTLQATAKPFMAARNDEARYQRPVSGGSNAFSGQEAGTAAAKASATNGSLSAQPAATSSSSAAYETALW